ncbi:Uncharacterised protein [Mycobacterium tuberculosis]|nr:Uncharacterised protein [Mycobacterium tuberculosis]
MIGISCPTVYAPPTPISPGRPNARATSTTSIDRYADVPVRLCAIPR